MVRDDGSSIAQHHGLYVSFLGSCKQDGTRQNFTNGVPLLVKICSFRLIQTGQQGNKNSLQRINMIQYLENTFP